MRSIPHWIAGQAVPGGSGRTGPVYNPATGAVQAEVALASIDEVDRAVAAANDAFPAWRATSLSTSAIHTAFHQRNPEIMEILKYSPLLTPTQNIEIALMEKDSATILKIIEQDDLDEARLIQIGSLSKSLEVIQYLVAKGISIRDILNDSLRRDIPHTVEIILDNWDIPIYEREEHGKITATSPIIIAFDHVSEKSIRVMFDRIPRRVIEELFEYLHILSLRIFLDYGVAIGDFPDAFIMYVNQNNIPEVRQFIRHNVDIHYDNELALHIAVGDGYEEMVELLLDNGADPTVNDYQAYREAILEQQDDIISILVKYYDDHQLDVPNTFRIIDNPEDCLPQSNQRMVDFEPHTGPVLGYGNPHDGYVCFDLGELLDNFRLSEYRNPYNLSQLFTRDDLQDIQKIVHRDYDYQEGVFTLDEYTMFNQFMINIQLEEEQASEHIEFLQSVPYKGHLRRLFVYLFAIGMYFRQWKGPGHPYPLRSQSTGTEMRMYCIEETHLLQAVGIVYSLYNQTLSELPDDIRTIYQDLNMVGIVSGQLTYLDDTIKGMYAETLQSGNLCIRMSSSPFVVTGAYYLYAVLKEDIPDYHLGLIIDPIQ